MKTKKLLSMICVGAAAVSLLAGCGSSSGSSQESDTSDTAAQNEASEENTANADTESGNVLVVYYSATGNTENVANMIAEITGADVFELEPAEPYSDTDLDWTDDSSRVVSEYENEDLRDIELVANTVDNWDSYDTVFIGYPIWLAYHILIQCTQLA